MSSHDDDMPLYSVIAEKLLALGWRSDCDAQHMNLRDALPELRTLLSPVERDGGPAFPVECSADHIDNGHQTGHRLFQQYGMSLRDYFAAKAMQGMLADLPKTLYGLDWQEKTAAAAYEVADAMLKARAA